MYQYKPCPQCQEEVTINVQIPEDEMIPCEFCGFEMSAGEWDEVVSPDD